ncbi:BTAD domain-containing putative transcriptional regulator [Spirillospora sp. CA-294931]|uniref:AfsR/SARP family transcriptional regulator n=1 Tax=Spirillospora sp. CA-294931 TaxID=3240042 RepID=UPI003D906CDB
MSVGNQRVPIRSTKQRIVLSTLLLNAERFVTVDELIERLWEKPPSDARGTAQVHLGRLRRTLLAAHPARSLIRTEPQGYAIEMAGADLDLARFEDLAGAAKRETEPRHELALLREALSLWHGRPFSNVPSEFIQRHDVPQLAERRLQLAERRFELELELTGAQTVIGELRALAHAEPFRERLWALLMTALYRQGRQQEALECYRVCAAVLREEIGLDPGEELRNLHQAILEGAPQAPAPAARTQPAAPREAPCQLPPEIGDFVGRARLLEHITGHLAAGASPSTVPILAVVGTPGVGKTALAVKAAHLLRPAFPDGQLYVQLGGSVSRPRDPRDSLGDLLNGLGEPGPYPDDLEGRATMLRERLADRRVLLVIDDVADVAQARVMLPGTRGCGVLLTSRQRLVGLPGVERVRPGPLSPGEAREFLERLVGAERVRQEHAVADEIARMCGLLPLALRIVGVRLALRPWQTLARLAVLLRDKERRLDELATQDLQMRAVLDGSYAALDPAARRLLHRLGTLCDAEFVEGTALELAGDRGDGAQALDRLVEANLVEPLGSGLAGEPRFRLPGLVAIHASQRLEHA